MTGRAAGVRPDRQFHYSNLGYGLLGEIVARLRGRPGGSWSRAPPRPPRHDGRRPTSLRAGTQTAGASTTSRRPCPRAAHRHRGDGAGRAAVVHPRRPRDVRPVPAGGPARRAGAVRWRWRSRRRPVRAAGYGLALMLGFQIFRGGSGTLVGHSGSMPGFHAIRLVDRDSGIGRRRPGQRRPPACRPRRRCRSSRAGAGEPTPARRLAAQRVGAGRGRRRARAVVLGRHADRRARDEAGDLRGTATW